MNGVAIGVLELKKSVISIADGIRQNLSNQEPEFNAWFFSTVQFIFAGNDSEGLKYGTILTAEKYFLKWKEDEADETRFKLDKYLLKLCEKNPLIELMHDFILFDGGIKKLPRAHQYFGIKAAQEHVRERRSRQPNLWSRRRQACHSIFLSMFYRAFGDLHGEVDGDPALKLALELDTAIKSSRPDDWRGVQARLQAGSASPRPDG